MAFFRKKKKEIAMQFDRIENHCVLQLLSKESSEEW